MKKHIFFLLSLCIVMLSCKDDDPDMIIDNPNITFESVGGSQTVAFETNVDWSAKVPVNWCAVSPSSGDDSAKGITITVIANDTHSERRCSVTITTCCFTKLINVTQKRANLPVDSN